MNVCINYAQGDKAFANQLAIQLCSEIHCGTFLWEMPTGDLLDEDVRNNPDVDAIVILLSVESAALWWCQEFLCAELLHKIEDKGTAVILVMIEDCEIPPFAQSKMIADFRGATAEETSPIAGFIVWKSTWTSALSEHYRQAIMSGKSPDDCRPQRIKSPARLRLEHNDLFNQLCFHKT